MEASGANAVGMSADIGASSPLIPVTLSVLKTGSQNK